MLRFILGVFSCEYSAYAHFIDSCLACNFCLREIGVLKMQSEDSVADAGVVGGTQQVGLLAITVKHKSE